MDQRAKAEALRDLHIPGDPLLLLNAWDAASAVVIVSGPTRCEPQRSCSFAARSPVSYDPIEMCSAPWYDVRS